MTKEMEAIGTMTTVPADFQKMLDRVHSATLDVGRGDPAAYMALWSNADDVSLFGAWGPCKQGWDEVSRTFRWVGTRFGGGDIVAEVAVAHVNGDIGYTVGYERGDMTIDGEPKSVTIRVTHIYRREAGDWKLIHRHGDFAPIDESIGKV
jgi:ketosteroid isomerase-like protein